MIVHRAEAAYVADDHPRAWQRVGATIMSGGSASESRLGIGTEAPAVRAGGGPTGPPGYSEDSAAQCPQAGGSPAASAQHIGVEALKARRERLARDVLLLTASAVQPRPLGQFGLGTVVAV